MGTLSWTICQMFGKVPQARWGHASVVDGTKFYIFGGICGPNHAGNQLHCMETDPSMVKQKIDEEVETIRKKNLVQRASMDEFESMLYEFDSKLQLRIARHKRHLSTGVLLC